MALDIRLEVKNMNGKEVTVIDPNVHHELHKDPNSPTEYSSRVIRFHNITKTDKTVTVWCSDPYDVTIFNSPKDLQEGMKIKAGSSVTISVEPYVGIKPAGKAPLDLSDPEFARHVFFKFLPPYGDMNPQGNEIVISC